MSAPNSQQNIADASAIAAWFGWFLSHLADINGVLQFILLLVSIAAGIVAIRYHVSGTGK